jgi:hypothetical protein
MTSAKGMMSAEGRKVDDIGKEDDVSREKGRLMTSAGGHGT